ncbi:uroporphyrinogen-III C-methyltransferase [Malikia spinosa]|uniref:uroporphyrinogen-III C-methyltransferase n=1 Tax=Malikia spinosa TaxID=86180 RepID=UPI002FDAACFE
MPPSSGGLLPKFALGLALLAAGASATLWLQLQAVRKELARRSSDTGTLVTEAREQSARAESLVQDLQVRLGVAEVRLSEVSLQRSQLDELMLTVSRTRDDSLVQDLESTLRLAQQQAQLTGSVQPLISALQSADQRIARAAQPRLNPVQRAIARDIERIQAAALVDLPALAGRLDELIGQLDELPLLNAVAPAQSNGPEVPAVAVKAEPVTPAQQAAPAAGASAWQRLQSWWFDWSARAWANLSARGSELVRVHRVDQPEAMLLAPDQEFFLRENTKLKLLNARLALLARQLGTASADLRAVEATLQRYFDGQAKPTQLALETLQGLQRDLRLNQLPDPDDALAALAAAAGGR